MALILKKGKYLTRGETYLLGGNLLLTRTVFPHGRELPSHYHQDAYLATVTKGGYLETGEGFTDEVSPGDAIFHPAGEIHADLIGKQGAVVMNFELSEAFWQEKGIADLKPEARLVVRDPRFLDLARRISDEMDSPTRQSVIGMEGLALEIIDIFLKLAMRPKGPSDVLKEADAFIRENFRTPLTTEVIADEFRVSADALARKFRRHFGETITDRIIRLRINEAVRLLDQGYKTLAEIAVMSGFFDQSHFTKAFKRRRGISPGQHRKQTKKI